MFQTTNQMNHQPMSIIHLSFTTFLSIIKTMSGNDLEVPAKNVLTSSPGQSQLCDQRFPRPPHQSTCSMNANWGLSFHDNHCHIMVYCGISYIFYVYIVQLLYKSMNM